MEYSNISEGCSEWCKGSVLRGTQWLGTLYYLRLGGQQRGLSLESGQGQKCRNLGAIPGAGFHSQGFVENRPDGRTQK